MRTLTITYDEWGDSKLRRPHFMQDPGKMCCLGFGCLLLDGVSVKDIDGHSMPTDLKLGTRFEREFGLSLRDQKRAAELNDDFHRYMRNVKFFGEFTAPEAQHQLHLAKQSLKKLRDLFRRNGTTLRIVGLPGELR